MVEKALKTNKIYTGDCLEVMRSWPDGCVHMVMTSPPYWGLRDYGTDGQLGLEKTPDLYVEKMVCIFREIKRILRDDGTLWLNLGDSYVGNGPGARDIERWPKQSRNDHRPTRSTRTATKMKPKNLVGVPWRVAFALQSEGWYLRSDIVWAKPNPMVESVKDRPTKAHEYLFLLSKKENYFYDSIAIREVGVYPAGTLAARGSEERKSERGVNARPPEYKEYDGYRNARSVWTIQTQPYPGAHFATFPEELCRRPILAGTSEKGACPKCGAPWSRIIEKMPYGKEDYDGKHSHQDKSSAGRNVLASVKAARKAGGAHDNPFPAPKTIGWNPSCSCGCTGTLPCIVLDPFCGSGTTCLVANNHRRRWIGIDLNPEYVKLAKWRIRQKCIWELP